MGSLRAVDRPGSGCLGYFSAVGLLGIAAIIRLPHEASRSNPAEQLADETP